MVKIPGHHPVQIDVKLYVPVFLTLHAMLMVVKIIESESAKEFIINQASATINSCLSLLSLHVQPGPETCKQRSCPAGT